MTYPVVTLCLSETLVKNYNTLKIKYERNPNKKVSLKYLQNITSEFLSQVKSYSIEKNDINRIYGMSQNPYTKDYIIVLHDDYFKIYCEKCDKKYNGINGISRWCKPCQINGLKNKTNWSNENEKIDSFIQEMQLKIDNSWDIVFEWIPYNQFNDVKEMGKVGFITTYSAEWKDGLLIYNIDKKEYIRKDKIVVLKCLHSSQNITDELLNNEVKSYLIEKCNDNRIYGMSQNPYTKDYIIVLHYEYFKIYCEKCDKKYTNSFNEWCKPCQINSLKGKTNWSSENEKIGSFIQEMQLKIDNPQDIVFEWIPYDQFNDIKEMEKGGFTIVYSAEWKEGPLIYNIDKQEYIRSKNKKVALKCLYNSQNITDELLNNEVKSYSIKKYDDEKIYGMSQNPHTKDYIIVTHYEYLEIYCAKCDKNYTNRINGWCKPCQINSLKRNWSNKDEKIDSFIQEMQLKIDNPQDIVFEWIPYDQFNDIKEMEKGDFTTVYSAEWRDGPLIYNIDKQEYIRSKNKKVILIYIYNSQNITDEFLNNKVKGYSINYGISQNPDTKDYIIVFQGRYCEKCSIQYYNAEHKQCNSCRQKIFTSWTSENRKINDFIQEMQLDILNKPGNIVFEWISYNQFNCVKKIGKGGFATVYSAKWKDGPLHYDQNGSYKRNPNKKVALKCLYKSQYITNEFLNEIKNYSTNAIGHILKIYGISQNPNTKDYIMVLDYAEGRDLNYWVKKNHKGFDWSIKIKALSGIIQGLNEIHQKQIVHRDFHTGNILSSIISLNLYNSSIYISDMGLCGEVENTDERKIYGVTSYVAPEVLRGNPYTQAADIYSFGMIMYFVATGKQPFSNCTNDEYLVLEICKNGKRPEINEPEAPRCYIDLMKKCLDSNPDNRPKTAEICELIELFHISYAYDKSDFKRYIKIEKGQQHYEIEKQFKEAEEYRRISILFDNDDGDDGDDDDDGEGYDDDDNDGEDNDDGEGNEDNNDYNSHPQSQLLNPLLSFLNSENSECLDCKITDRI